jgi:hypothetical protein
LVSAIFVPFHGVPKDKPIAKDRDEKLRRILEDLDKHQDAVRRNMMYLATLQKEKLLSDALERERARDKSSDLESVHTSYDPELEQDIKQLLESLKEPAVRGTSGKEYEYEDGDFDEPPKDAPGGVTDSEGDAPMGGMDHATSHKRNIHLELNAAIRDLVVGTASQIEMYDRHAETTKDYYRRALERHNLREGIVSGITAAPTNDIPTAPAQERRPGGILRHTNSEIRVNTEVLARIAKEEQSFSPNQQIQSAADVSKEKKRSSVDYSRDPRRNSVQFAQDSRKASMDVSKDIWRR